MRKILIILGAITALGIAAASCTGGPTTASGESTTSGTPAKAATPVAVNYKTFGDEFDSNQVAAERKWNGKRVTLTSTVTNITDGHIALKASSKEFSLTQISCDLTDESQALKVTNGKTATVTGTVDGQSMGVITLKDCTTS